MMVRAPNKADRHTASKSGAGQGQEALMDVSSSPVADTQASEAVQPAQRSLDDHPTPTPQALATFDAAPGDAHDNATLSQSLPMAGTFVTFCQAVCVACR